MDTMENGMEMRNKKHKSGLSISPRRGRDGQTYVQATDQLLWGILLSVLLGFQGRRRSQQLCSKASAFTSNMATINIQHNRRLYHGAFVRSQRFTKKRSLSETATDFRPRQERPDPEISNQKDHRNNPSWWFMNETMWEASSQWFHLADGCINCRPRWQHIRGRYWPIYKLIPSIMVSGTSRRSNSIITYYNSGNFSNHRAVGPQPATWLRAFRQYRNQRESSLNQLSPRLRKLWWGTHTLTRSGAALPMIQVHGAWVTSLMGNYWAPQHMHLLRRLIMKAGEACLHGLKLK